MKNYISLFIISLIFAGCVSSRVAQTQLSVVNRNKALADSVLAYALDHEALYTLADTLKPMSSVKFLRYSIAKDSTQKDGDYNIRDQDSLIKKIEEYQQVCQDLSQGDWQFIMMPFARTEKNMRNMEIYVVRKSEFAKKIKQYQPFFGQWGFTPSTDPAVVLAVIEYESKWDRNRAYGYLFGYPAYAVDFFVEAQKIQDIDVSKKNVPRDFFAIPVYVGKQGYFTYATPKAYKPTETDSTLYIAASKTLGNYKNEREKFVEGKGLNGLSLWEHLKKQN
ncbi:MAG: hypothetical protein ACI8WW_001107 [Oceanospirillaceae bacterium]|jgi:hypothetical protein